LGAADKKTVTLKLEVDPNAPAPVPLNAAAAPVAAHAAPKPSAAPPPVAPPSPAKSPNRAPAYVALGVGLAGIGVGSAFGIMAMNGKNDLNGCTSSSCPPSNEDALDKAKRNGNISTVAFAVGGASLVLGTVLLFTVGSSHESHASAPPARGFAGLQRGRAMIGPGSVQLAADF